MIKLSQPVSEKQQKKTSEDRKIFVHFRIDWFLICEGVRLCDRVSKTGLKGDKR